MNPRLEMLIEIRARLLALQPPRGPAGAIGNSQWRAYDNAIEFVDRQLHENAESVAIIKTAVERSIVRCRELRKQLVSKG